MRLSSLCLAAGLTLCAACGGLADGVPPGQIVRSDGTFQSAKLSSSGGMPSSTYTGDECDPMSVEIFEVDATASTATWDRCIYNYAARRNLLSQGTRALAADELATIRNALLQVQIGNGSRGMCGLDKPTVILDVQVNGIVGRYVDDFYGCMPAPDGRTFVKNIDAVAIAMWNLAS